MSNESDENTRKQKIESYNHELTTSESFYVGELNAIINHIVHPFEKCASRCHVKDEKEIDFVFGILKHLNDFHAQFLRIIQSELSVIDSFATYIEFLRMYLQYFDNFSQIIDTVANWSKHVEFREFIALRLNNEHCRQYIDGRLCSMPWYFYRPFERIKQYYRFIKDLGKLTKRSDGEYKKLLKIKQSMKPLHDKIRRCQGRYMRKTRLLEIQLQILNNPEPIVCDRRYFIYNRLCQVMQTGIGNKKYKHIHLYVFNDHLLWTSKRGQFKKAFHFKHTNLVYGIPSASSDSNATLFIQYGSKHKKATTSKRSRQRKSRLSRISMSFSKSALHSIGNDEKDDDDSFDDAFADIMHSMENSHGNPTKKIMLVFVNEQARNQCLDIIKTTHAKYVKKMHDNNQCFTFDKNKLSIRTSGGDEFSSMTRSYSNSQSSFYGSGMDSSNILTHPKALDSIKYNLPTPTHSNVSSITQGTLLSDDYIHSDSSFSDLETSKSSKSVLLNTPNHSNNSSLSSMADVTKPRSGSIKKSVSTVITTIQEEEEDVKEE